MLPFRAYLTEATTMESLTQEMRRLGIDVVELGRNKKLAEECLAAMTYMKTQGYRMPEKFRVYPGMGRNAGVYSPSNDCIFLNPTLKSLTGSTPFHASSHRFQFVFHEMGHMLHYDNVTSLYDSIKNRYWTAEMKQRIVSEVSTYAATNALEFVAEVFAGQLAGKQYPDDILTQYRLAGGP